MELLFPWEGAGSELAASELPVRVEAYLRRRCWWRRCGGEKLASLRRAIRATKPDVVLVVTAYLPAALGAARLAGVPAVLYAAELLGGRAAAFRAVGRSARRIVAPSGSKWRGSIGRERRGHPAWDRARTARSRRAAGDAAAHRRGRGAEPRPGSGRRARRAVRLVRAEVLRPPRCSSPASPIRERPTRSLRRSSGRAAGEGVHFLGAVVEIESLLAAADVVVVPNRVEEGFGRVPSRRWPVGTPVVATPLTAAARLLSERELLVVPEERPDLLAQAVVRLLRDPALASSLVASRGSGWQKTSTRRRSAGGSWRSFARSRRVGGEGRWSTG